MNARLRQIFEFLDKHRFNGACAAISVLALGIAAYFFKDSSAVTQEYDALSQEGGSMLETRRKGPTLRQELDFARAAVQRIEDNLFDEGDLPGNDEYFRGIASQARVVLDNLQQLSTPVAATPANYKAVPFRVLVTGTYNQVYAFLLGVETGPRLANISAFSMRRSPATEGLVTLEVSVELLGRS